MNRCVRRVWLCGHDPVTGSCYVHRKQWIEDRLEELAGSFAVDVCGFSAMSNHVHVVFRTRPDVAEAWSDEEVARRWWRLFPKRRDEEGAPAEPGPQELRMLVGVADESALAERRRRLADLSWFMRCLSELIARRANAEDHVTGRLERLGVRGESWVDCVQNFGRWFHRAAGSVRLLARAAGQAGRRWFHGVSRCREAFA